MINDLLANDVSREDMENRTEIEKYEIVSEVRTESAQCAISTVHKGRDSQNKRPSTLRVTRFLDGCQERKIREIKGRYLREAEVAQKLSHQGIVSVYDVAEDDDSIYLIMEHFEGESLERYCKRGSLLPLSRILDIVAQAADTLDYIHTNGVIHRNLKPANVMLLRDGTVKITGFGLARFSADQRPRIKKLLGTPNYMSPEQAMDLEIDARSDIFSLGVLFFQLLTGELPFRGEDLAGLLRQILRKRHCSVRMLNQKIPPVVQRIVDKALAKNPERRYQRACEMAEDIRLAKKGV